MSEFEKPEAIAGLTPIATGDTRALISKFLNHRNGIPTALDRDYVKSVVRELFLLPDPSQIEIIIDFVIESHQGIKQSLKQRALSAAAIVRASEELARKNEGLARKNREEVDRLAEEKRIREALSRILDVGESEVDVQLVDRHGLLKRTLGPLAVGVVEGIRFVVPHGADYCHLFADCDHERDRKSTIEIYTIEDLGLAIRCLEGFEKRCHCGYKVG